MAVKRSKHSGFHSYRHQPLRMYVLNSTYLQAAPPIWCDLRVVWRTRRKNNTHRRFDRHELRAIRVVIVPIWTDPEIHPGAN
jgi:hypothetical protein